MTILGSDEVAPQPGDRINEALVGFTGCLGDAFDDLCTYGFIVGDSYAPFAPDPEEEAGCEDDDCSTLWVRVTSINPLSTEGFDGGDCAMSMRVNLEVGILRCVEVVAEGESPTATEVLTYAMQAMKDMNKILCAAMDCEVWDAINVGEWEPLGPLGGEYGGTWSFSAELS